MTSESGIIFDAAAIQQLGQRLVDITQDAASHPLLRESARRVGNKLDSIANSGNPTAQAVRVNLNAELFAKYAEERPEVVALGAIAVENTLGTLDTNNPTRCRVAIQAQQLLDNLVEEGDWGAKVISQGAKAAYIEAILDKGTQEQQWKLSEMITESLR
jgi:hypothetical protein